MAVFKSVFNTDATIRDMVDRTLEGEYPYTDQTEEHILKSSLKKTKKMLAQLIEKLVAKNFLTEEEIIDMFPEFRLED
jgi:hypothetical protein